MYVGITRVRSRTFLQPCCWPTEFIEDTPEVIDMRAYFNGDIPMGEWPEGLRGQAEVWPTNAPDEPEPLNFS